MIGCKILGDHTIELDRGLVKQLSADDLLAAMGDDRRAETLCRQVGLREQAVLGGLQRHRGPGRHLGQVHRGHPRREVEVTIAIRDDPARAGQTDVLVHQPPGRCEFPATAASAVGVPQSTGLQAVLGVVSPEPVGGVGVTGAGMNQVLEERRRAGSTVVRLAVGACSLRHRPGLHRNQ